MRKTCWGLLALLFCGYSVIIACDPTIAAKVQMTNGGDTMTVCSGGTVAIESGATFTSATTLAIATADNLTVGGNIVPQVIEVTYTMLANGSLADQSFFVANRAYEVTACSFVGSVAGSDGGAVNLQVTKDTSTNAPGAGTDLLTNNTNAGFNLKGTANTVQNGTLVASATLSLAAGDRLSVDFAGTLTAVAGVTVTCSLKPDA